MDPEYRIYQQYGYVRSGWNEAQMLIRGPLTDKKIARYQKRGFYTAEFKEERRKYAAQKRVKRRGNFIENEGRLIYSPL